MAKNIQSLKMRYGLIGNTEAFNRALSVAVQVAPTNLSVLIFGESGVGKEVFSQIIHSLGARKHNPFIAVNCGAIPEGTIDSELFGHEKGAFTGATDNRKGYFEVVDGGTIFLDEIAEMPMSTQARLLRVLESGEFIKVGSSKVNKTDVRIVAATNKDLLSQVHKGKFREDLYYRLNTVPINIPPLRERREDILKLFKKFTVDFAEQYNEEAIKLTTDAQNVLLNYRWPGNIRELKNFAEQVSVLSNETELDANDLLQYLPKAKDRNSLPVLASSFFDNEGSDLSDRELLYKVLVDMKRDLNDLKGVVYHLVNGNNISEEMLKSVSIDELTSRDLDVNRMPTTSHQEHSPIIIGQRDKSFESVKVEEVEENLSIAEMEKELIIKALQKHRGKRKDAALDLGISERTLYRKIKEYHVKE